MTAAPPSSSQVVKAGKTLRRYQRAGDDSLLDAGAVDDALDVLRRFRERTSSR